MAGQGERRPSTTVERFATLDLKTLARDQRVDVLLGDGESLENSLVESDQTAAGHGPKREFLLSGDAELTNDEDIQRKMQFARNLEGYGNASARQGEHNSVPQIRLVAKHAGQGVAGFPAIVEDHGSPFSTYRSWRRDRSSLPSKHGTIFGLHA